MIEKFNNQLVAEISQLRLITKNIKNVELFYDYLVQNMSDMNHALLCAVSADNIDLVRAIVRSGNYKLNYVDPMGGCSLLVWAETDRMREYLKSVGFKDEIKEAKKFAINTYAEEDY